MRAVVMAAIVPLTIVAYALPASAQNITVVQSSAPASSNTSRVPGEVPPEAQVAVPVAASSDLGGNGQKSIAPTVGFQVWKKDRFFLGSFFSVAASDSTVSEKHGSLLLNPPMTGRSFYVAGNCTLYPTWCGKPGQVADSAVLVGIGGRWGTTGADIQFTPTGGTATSRNAFATYQSVTLQVLSKTMAIELKDTTSEFQIGLEIGPTWRMLGGDFGEDDAFRKQVLGTTKSSFVGLEATFFLRLNSVQPFARFSKFGRPDGVVINGFTGRQIVWGVNVASALFQAAVK